MRDQQRTFGKMKISVVSPVYEADSLIDELVRSLVLSLEEITSDFEVVLVEDCSADSSWQQILASCRKDSRIKGIKHSKNYGQQLAILSGLKETSGDYVVVMDCDLEDNPKYIKDMTREIEKGYDVVIATSENRNCSAFRRLSSLLFGKLLNTIAGRDLHNQQSSGYSMIRKNVVKELINNYTQYLYALKDTKFKTFYLDTVSNEKKKKSSYSIIKLVQFAFSSIFMQLRKSSFHRPELMIDKRINI